MIINEKYMKQFSPIPLNYNMAEVKNYIPVAEKIWVIPLIGSDLFDEINDQVANNTVSLKNMITGEQQNISSTTLIDVLNKTLNK